MRAGEGLEMTTDLEYYQCVALDIENGLRSGFPPCCIAWFIEEWQHEVYDERYATSSGPLRAKLDADAKKYFEDTGRQYGYVPCPQCRTDNNIAVVRSTKPARNINRPWKKRHSFTPEIMNDLWFVGEAKPLGYLPIHTIQQCGFEVGEVCEHLFNRGLFTRLYKQAVDMENIQEGECDIWSGALYSAHLPALSKLIAEEANIPAPPNWNSSSPGAFVDSVAKITADEEQYPALYKLIARMFGKTV